MAIERLLTGGDDLAALQNAARARQHLAAFTWDKVLGEYEVLLRGWAD